VSAWVSRLWRLLDHDLVRAPLLVLYYLALIYVLVRMYGGLRPAPPVPFVYQGF
jgi:hypothetical protein